MTTASFKPWAPIVPPAEPPLVYLLGPISYSAGPPANHPVAPPPPPARPNPDQWLFNIQAPATDPDSLRQDVY